MSWTNLALLLIGSLAFLAGGTLAKTYTINQSGIFLGLALLLYTVGNVIVIEVMKQAGLGVTISLTTIIQLIATNTIAILYFQERLSSMQAVGLVLGLISFCLIAFFPLQEN